MMCRGHASCIVVSLVSVFLFGGCGLFSSRDYEGDIYFFMESKGEEKVVFCKFQCKKRELTVIDEFPPFDVSSAYINWDMTKLMFGTSLQDGDNTILHLYDAMSGEFNRSELDIDYQITDFSKDGRYCVGYEYHPDANYGRQSFSIYALEDRELERTSLPEEFSLGETRRRFLNTDTIIFKDWEGDVYMINRHSSNPPSRIDTLKNAPFEIQISPDGQLIATHFPELAEPNSVSTSSGIAIVKNDEGNELVKTLYINETEPQWFIGTGLSKDYIRSADVTSIFWATNDELCIELTDDNKEEMYLVFYSIMEGIKGVCRLPPMLSLNINIQHEFVVSKDKRFIFFPRIISEPSLNLEYSHIFVIDREKKYAMSKLLRKHGVRIYFPEQIPGE